jgi:host factor-I protein
MAPVFCVGCLIGWSDLKEQKNKMDNKPAQNIQDSFLNTARKDKAVITIYLLSGVKLSGRIRSFDKYSVVLETNNQEQLIFKHAISTVVMARAHTDRPAHAAAPAGAPSAPASGAAPSGNTPQG